MADSRGSGRMRSAVIPGTAGSCSVTRWPPSLQVRPGTGNHYNVAAAAFARSARLARAIVTGAFPDKPHAIRARPAAAAAVTNGFSFKWEYRIYSGCR